MNQFDDETNRVFLTNPVKASSAFFRFGLIQSFMFLGLLFFVQNLSAQVTGLTGDHHITADGSETGHLELDGGLSVGGNFLDFGTTVETLPRSALALDYLENSSVYTFTLSATRDNVIFLWQDNAGVTASPKMKLDGNNVLTIYDTSGNPAIVLDPSNPALWLTEEAADDRYVSSSIFTVETVIDELAGTGPAISIASASAEAPFSFAWGPDSRAMAAYSVAMGSSVFASGYNSVALGTSNYALGDYSTVMGEQNTANGVSSTAMGSSTVAHGYATTALGGYTRSEGYYSTSMGSGTLAIGQSATSMGMNTIAQGAAQLAIGFGNVPQGFSASEDWGWPFSNSFAATHQLFIIGNGHYDTESVLHTSNAFTVAYNGDTWLAGKLKAEQGAEFNGEIKANGRIRVAPQGDLSMGEFDQEHAP